MFGRKKAHKEKNIDIMQEISDFKVELLSCMPFYGDVLSYIDIKEDNEIATAATNGKVIYFNKSFMQGLKKEARYYVIIHELLHIMLLHWKRVCERNAVLWNIAADFVVNAVIDSMLDGMYHMESSFWLSRPEGVCCLDEYNNESVEELYDDICTHPNKYEAYLKIINVDLVTANELGEFEAQEWEAKLSEVIENAKKKWIAAEKYYYIPNVLLKLTNDKYLPWRKLLKRYLYSEQYEEISYDTPERKYLHMDMILPGVGLYDEIRIDEVWAFIDTSGSISLSEMNDFITQLYRVCKDFKATMNIAYWHTCISEVYRNIKRAEELLESPPSTTGGTNPHCIYEYIEAEKLEPKVILILTDGAFYKVNHPMVEQLKKKTVVVLSDQMCADDLSYMGRLAILH